MLGLSRGWGGQPRTFFQISERSEWTSFIYSRTSIKRPPSIKKEPLSKVQNFLSVKCCIRYLYSTAISIKRPRPLFCCCKFSIYCFFTSIRRPTNYLFKRNGDENCNLISTIMTSHNASRDTRASLSHPARYKHDNR